MEYTEVFPSELRMGAENESYMLLLSLSTGARVIPIIIGEPEAQSIIMAREEINPQRPSTHQLMTAIMIEYGLTIKQATIERFDEGIFYTNLTISDGFNEKNIDSRTSDAIALALYSGAPIMASKSVINDTSIEPLLLFGSSDEPNDSSQYETESLEQLEEKLQHCIETENYELAAEIQAKIDKIKNK